MLSAIWAQSLIIVNFPWKVTSRIYQKMASLQAYDDTVLSNYNMIANGCCFNDRVRPNMNVVSNLHRIIIEISAICFIWWPVGEERSVWCVSNGTECQQTS